MKRILAVDDNITSFKQIAAQLGDYYELSLAKSGEMAVKIFFQTSCDLVLLDVEMPDMNGFETLQKLQTIPWFGRTPVIFLTGNQDVATEVKGLAMGARDFITKPVEKSILFHRIELHLRFAQYQKELEEKVRELSDSVSTSFAELIECRDENTGGHVVRTSKYVGMLGEELLRQERFPGELSAGILDAYVRAAPLHDIGKVGIPDRILLKPGKLTDEEFNIMKNHAALGAEIVSHMYKRMPTQNYLQYAKMIAGCHHERWDGKGYPEGLKEEGIPLCARIMSVADVYDALVDDRVYRAAMPKDVARGVIRDGKGAQFDPAVVEAFENIFNVL